jgi:restriction endonuclease Mrr
MGSVAAFVRSAHSVIAAQAGDMTINSSNRNILDMVLEITARKSRVLLADHDVRRLSQRHEELQFLVQLIDDKPDRYIRIRAEEVEAEVINLRKAIGNIEAVQSPYGLLTQTYKRLLSEGHNLETATPALNQILAEGCLDNVSRVMEICKEKGANPNTLVELLSMHVKFRDLSIVDVISRTEHADWNGATSLNDLFNTEIASSDPDRYFDQRFINYLKENGEDLDRIHWRNFERIVADFFGRLGYVVELGPGSNDGGVDVRIWRDAGSSEGPPLVIVQCKRYGKKKQVSIEYVKAFYADVVHERATVGLIATTSKVAKGGKSVISARGYNLEVAEAQQIRDMIYGLWRIHFE